MQLFQLLGQYRLFPFACPNCAQGALRLKGKLVWGCGGGAKVCQELELLSCSMPEYICSWL